jgi:TFIIF-interacting CTD phosphatase-like protein
VLFPLQVDHIDAWATTLGVAGAVSDNESPDRKLLILDLDETLLFATENPLARPEAFRVGPYYVYLRPHVEPFLEWCASQFQVAVWTASSEDYAEAVVRRVFGSLDSIEFLWARRRCTRRCDLETRDQYWVKDLKKVRKQGYRLEQVIVVDDTSRKHERNYGNLVLVRRWEGREEDDELLHLRVYLETLVNVENVRAVEKRGWRKHVQSK